MEYMDGGSLEDLVQAGGCKDEDFLADVAYNVLRVSTTGRVCARMDARMSDVHAWIWG